MRTAQDVEDLVRLAWEADQEGRLSMRDALLTLTVTEGSRGLGGAVLGERFRRHLIAQRPDHWLASFPTVGQALGHPRVAAAVDRLRASYPAVRVQRLLLRAEAGRGPFRHPNRSLQRVIDDLLGNTQSVGATTSAALPFTNASGSNEPIPAEFLTYYLSVLLAIAILLASVLPASNQETRAA